MYFFQGTTNQEETETKSDEGKEILAGSYDQIVHH